VRLLPLFGLRRRHFDEHDLELVDSPLARTASPAQQATPGRFAFRFILVAAATVALALANGQLGVAAKGLDESGRPAVAAFVDRPTAGRAWKVRRVEQIRWASPYYGRHSSWVRYRLRPVRGIASRDRFTVWTDAVLSPDLGALDAFSLAHCYAFHGFDVRASLHVDLGNGVVGRVFVYKTKAAQWHTVAWEWPVLRHGKVEHERIVLLASTTSRPRARIRARSTWLRGRIIQYLDTRAPDDDPNPQLSRALVGLATQMVSARVAAA
jgi:hypothetical protein